MTKLMLEFVIRLCNVDITEMNTLSFHQHLDGQISSSLAVVLYEQPQMIHIYSSFFNAGCNASHANILAYKRHIEIGTGIDTFI